jgi:hypothetical protein
MFRCMLIFLLAGMVLASCAGNDTENDIDDAGLANAPVIPLIDRGAFDNKITPLSFIDNVQAVTLRGTDDPNSIIAHTEKVIRADGKYFVFDSKFYGIKVFDNAGNFLYRVGKTGKGPGEYTRINDVELFGPSTLAVLADNQVMIYYDLSGNYLRSKRTGFFASDFEMLDKNNFFFYTNNNVSEKSKSYNLLQTDSNFSIRQRYMKIKSREEVPSFEFTGSLVKGNDGVLYAEPFSDRILQLDKDKFKTQYRIDFAGRSMPEELKTDPRLFVKKGINYDYMGKSMVDVQDYFFATCIVKKRLEYIIYDKKQGKCNMVSNVDVDSDYMAKLFSTPVGKDERSLIISLAPEMVEYLKETGQEYLDALKKKDPQLHSVLTSPKEIDNPILLVCNVSRNDTRTLTAK